MGRLGYSVGRNKPYAGGFITEHYGNPASGLHTIQLELNRAIYMDERRRSRSERFAQVADDFTVLAEVLAALPLDGLEPFRLGGGMIAIIAGARHRRKTASDRQFADGKNRPAKKKGPPE